MTSDLQRILGRIEAKLETILEEQRDQRKKITTLERKMWTWQGAFGVLFVVYTFFSDTIKRMIGL